VGRAADGGGGRGGDRGEYRGEGDEGAGAGMDNTGGGTLSMGGQDGSLDGSPRVDSRIPGGATAGRGLGLKVREGEPELLSHIN